MPDLAQKLRSIAARVAQDHPTYAKLADAFIERLRKSGAGRKAPEVGELLPPFLLPDTNGRLHSLAELSGGRGLVIAFVRGHWCSFCVAHVEALWEAAERIEAQGARIVVISPERARYAAALSSAHVTVLCDMDSGYAGGLDLAVAMDPEMADELKGLGDDVCAFNGGAGWIVPIPATFVLDGAGRIQAKFIDADYRQRMSIEGLLAALS